MNDRSHTTLFLWKRFTKYENYLIHLHHSYNSQKRIYVELGKSLRLMINQLVFSLKGFQVLGPSTPLPSYLKNFEYYSQVLAN